MVFLNIIIIILIITISILYKINKKNKIDDIPNGPNLNHIKDMTSVKSVLYNFVKDNIQDPKFIKFMEDHVKVPYDLYIDSCIEILIFTCREKLEANKDLMDKIKEENPEYKEDDIIEAIYQLFRSSELTVPITDFYINAAKKNIAEGEEIEKETKKYNDSFGDDNKFDDPIKALHPRDSSNDLDSYDITEDKSVEDLINTNTIEDLDE